jgi:hypothetical protein
MRQRRVSLDVLDFSLLIIDQYPNKKIRKRFDTHEDASLAMIRELVSIGTSLAASCHHICYRYSYSAVQYSGIAWNGALLAASSSTSSRATEQLQWRYGSDGPSTRSPL